jgi:hypothetical protein
MQGLINSKSAVIQMDGTGYDNKEFQTARYSDKKMTSFPEPMNGINSLASVKKSGIINNYSSLAAKNTSSFRMNSMLEINKMF